MGRENHVSESHRTTVRQQVDRAPDWPPGASGCTPTQWSDRRIRIFGDSRDFVRGRKWCGLGGSRGEVDGDGDTHAHPAECI